MESFQAKLCTNPCQRRSHELADTKHSLKDITNPNVYSILSPLELSTELYDFQPSFF